MCLDLLLGCLRALQSTFFGGGTDSNQPTPSRELETTEYSRPGEHGESESIVDTKLDYFQEDKSASTVDEAQETEAAAPAEPKEEFKPVKVAKKTTAKPVTKPKVVKEKREKVSIE